MPLPKIEDKSKLKQQLENWAIRIKKGVGKPRGRLEVEINKNNKIVATVSQWWLMIPIALVKNFMRIGNIFFLAVSLIMLIDPTLSPYFRWIMIFPLLFFTVIFVWKELYILVLRNRAYQQINHKKARLYSTKKTDSKEFTEVNWEELRPGDIINLRRDEICPADVLILDTGLSRGGGKICWVDTHSIEGFTQFDLKRSVQGTKNVGSVKKLDARLQYEPPNKKFQFKGTIKVDGSFHYEQLTLENCILRGSVIRNTDSVDAICLYTGHDTKLMLNSTYPIGKKSHFEYITEKFFGLGLFIVLLFTAVSTSVLLINSDDLNINLADRTIDYKRIFYFFILYSPLVPISLYGIYDLILLFKRINIHRTLNHSGADGKIIKVLDPNTAPNLGHVDYVLMDKTGTLTTANYTVKRLFVMAKKENHGEETLTSRLYSLDEKVLFPKLAANLENKPKFDNAPIGISQIQIDDAEDIELKTPTKLHPLPSPVDKNGKMEFLNVSGGPVTKVSGIDVAEVPEENETGKSTRFYEELVRTTNKHPAGQLIYDHTQKKTEEGSENAPLLDEKKKSGKSIKFMEESGHQKKDSMSKDFGNLKSAKSTVDHQGKLWDGNENLKDEDFVNDYCLFPDRCVQLDFLMKNLALCHSASAEDDAKEGKKFNTPYPVELGLLKFAQKCGKIFCKTEPEAATGFLHSQLMNDGIEEKYRIVGVNDFSYIRKRSSVVYMHNKTQAAVVVKGAPENMKACLALNPEELKRYDALIGMLSKEGLKVQVIAHKILSRADSEKYEKDYKNFKSNIVFQSNDLEELANQFEKGCNLLGIVAMEDELREGAVETVKLCRDAGINMWMVTGDNRENAMNVAYNTGIINKDLTLRYLKVEKDDPKSAIKGILDQLKGQYEDEKKVGLDQVVTKDLDKKEEKKVSAGTNTVENLTSFPSAREDTKPLMESSGRKSLAPSENKPEETKVDFFLPGNKLKYALVIDGDSFEQIFNDKYCRANFPFIAALAYTVVAYRFSPWQKANLTKIIKQRFPDHPIVMSVGDGLNDSLMFQHSDISVELRTDDGVLPSFLGDIQIKSLKFIEDLLLVHGRNISEKVENSIQYLFYCSMYLGFPIFFYNFYVNFTGTPIYDSMLIFMYFFWFTSFAVVVYATLDENMSKEILKAFPALYIDGRLKKNQTWFNFIILFSESFIHSVITFFVSIYTVDLALSKQGWGTDFGMVSLVQYFSIVIVSNLKLLWHYKKNFRWFVLLFIIEIGSLALYIFIHDAAQFTYSDYANETSAIFKRAGSILTIFFCIFFLPAVTYIIKHYFIEKFFQTLYQWGSQMSRSVSVFTNKNILYRANPPMDLSQLATQVFKDMENMDNLVSQMISPADDENLVLKPFTLSYQNKPSHEKRYNMMISKKATFYARIWYPIIWILYGGYLLGQSLEEATETYSFSRFIVFFGFFVFGLIIYTDFYRIYYHRITLFYIFMAIALKLIYDWTRSENTIYMTAMIPIVTGTVFNIKFHQIFILHIIHFIVAEVRINLLYTNDGKLTSILPQINYNGTQFYASWSYIVIPLAIHLIVDALIYRFEKKRRIDHYQSSKLLVQQSTSGEILSLLLPDFVKDKYEQFMGGKCYKELQEEPVAILFCEVLEFHKILNKNKFDCVKILDEVFRQFDQICKQYGIQKIETVGSSYVACAGLKAAEAGVAPHLVSVPPVRRLLLMALDMVKFASTKIFHGDNYMKIWVGIHYGKCAAGVIGYHKPQFSLIGDTVNTTSRVCILKTDGPLPKQDQERLKGAYIRLSDEAYKALTDSGGPGRKNVRFDKIENVKFKGKPATTIWIKVDSNAPQPTGKGAGVTLNRPSLGVSGTGGAGAGGAKKFALGGMKDKLIAAVHTVIAQNDEKKKNQIVKLKQMLDFARAEKEKEKELEPAKGKRNDEEEEDDDDDEEEINLRPSRFLLTLDAYTYSKIKKFDQWVLDNNRKFYNVLLIFIHLFYLAQSLFYYLIVDDSFTHVKPVFGTRIGFLGLLLPLIFARDWLFRKRIIRQYNVIVFLYGITVSLVQGYYTPYESWQKIQLMEAFVLYLIGTHVNMMNFVGSLSLAVCILIDYFAIWGKGYILYLDNLFFFAIFLIANLVHVYIYQIQEVDLYNVSNAAGKRDSKQEFLVSQLLPTHARESFFGDPDGKNQIVDEFDDVTMLYTDIKGFTEFSNNKDPAVVVEALGALYTKFDELVFDINKSCKPDEPKLYKLYTIGDAYIVLSFLDKNKRDKLKEANNIVKIALSMRVAIEEVKRSINYSLLQMRLGIHTGSIVGGIVGTDIVRYDIYGVDSKIANEMESSSQENKINVSQVTKDILEGDPNCPYSFDENEEVVMEKFDVRMRCYFLEPKEEISN